LEIEAWIFYEMQNALHEDNTHPGNVVGYPPSGVEIGFVQSRVHPVSSLAVLQQV
jgi:hypothetical protein